MPVCKRGAEGPGRPCRWADVRKVELVDLLKNKMDMRAKHGKFFEKHPDWHYGRRVD